MRAIERTMVDPAEIRRVLIRGVNWVGDAVMTTPAIAGIRKTFPRAQISLLVKPWVAGVFAGNPHIDEILIYDGEGRHRGVTGLLRLARELRGCRFDLAILLQNAFEAALLVFLARIPRRVGYNTQGRGLLLTTAVVQDRSTKELHHVDYYRALLGALTWDRGDREPTLFLSSGTEDKAKALLEDEGVGPQETLVAFNPGSTYGSAKRWPADRYAALADRLIADLGVKVLLTGAKTDGRVAGAVRSVARYPERVIDLTGRTDIPLFAAVLKRCTVFVTNDTGAMHIGAAIGVPVVAIFGPTDPRTTSPVGRHVLLRHRVPCSPCLLRECPIDHRCMTGISVDHVFSSIIGIYNTINKVTH
ncbi:MAG TPA: lipopolysaccharide heptosyltransferase II [Candidatus Methylomirabilis sp.]|nr:lipopolysaccharide heptosyltransferase II [Candidatus Methylomirabilis sp.]